MDPTDLREIMMDPASRKLIRVTIYEDEPGETGDLVGCLMGKNPNCGSNIFRRALVCGEVGCLSD